MSRLNFKVRKVLKDVVLIWSADHKKFDEGISINRKKVLFPKNYLIEHLILEDNEMKYFIRELKFRKIPFIQIVEPPKMRKL